MMRIAGMGSIGFALILASAAVYAGEVRVGSAALQLSPPAGYCDLDQSVDHDKILFTNTKKLAEGAGNSFFTLFVGCQELQRVRGTREFIPTKIIVQGTMLGKADQTNLRATCDELKAIKISAQQKEMQDNVKKNPAAASWAIRRASGCLMKSRVRYAISGSCNPSSSRERIFGY